MQAVNSFLLFLTGGAVGVFYKIFGASLAAGETNAMLLTASIVSALLFGIAARAMNGKDAVRPDRRTVLFAALSAMTSCVYIRLNLALANLIPGAVFFSVSNGAAALLGALSGRVFFGERLRKAQIAGIALGVVSIAVIGFGG